MWRQCRWCDEVFELGMFRHSPNHGRGTWGYRCRNCRNEAGRKWNGENREKLNAKQRAYNASLSPEKAEAHRKRGKLWRDNNMERRRETAKKWNAANPEKYKAQWQRHNNKPATKARLQAYIKDNPAKWNAHKAHQAAVASGELVRPGECETCGVECKPVAHHDDYLKPLDVRWLCRPCHGDWHSLNGPGLNG